MKRILNVGEFVILIKSSYSSTFIMKYCLDEDKHSDRLTYKTIKTYRLLFYQVLILKNLNKPDCTKTSRSFIWGCFWSCFPVFVVVHPINVQPEIEVMVLVILMHYLWLFMNLGVSWKINNDPILISHDVRICSYYYTHVWIY